MCEILVGGGNNPDPAAVKKWGGDIDLSLWKDDRRPALLEDAQYMFYKAYGFNSEVPFGVTNLTNATSMF